MKKEDKNNLASGKKPQESQLLSPSGQFSSLARLSLFGPFQQIQQTNVCELLTPPHAPKKKNKDGLVPGKHPKKERLPEDRATVPQKSFTFPHLRKKDCKVNFPCSHLVMVEGSYDLQEEDNRESAWARHVQRNFDLSEKERDDLEKIMFGSKGLLKVHPMKWTMHEFVEYVKGLEVEKAPRAKNRFRWEKERRMEELLKYTQEALEKLDYVGVQSFGRIFQKAVTWKNSYTASDMVMARQTIKKYFEKTMDGMIIEAGYPPRKRDLVILDKPPPQSTESTPSLLVVESAEGKSFLGLIPNPTRKDLVEFLPKSNPPPIEQIVKAARAMGYTLINMPPWGSTK